MPGRIEKATLGAVVSTAGADGIVNLALMGVYLAGDSLSFRPYRDTRIYVNLSLRGEGVVNLTEGRDFEEGRRVCKNPEEIFGMWEEFVRTGVNRYRRQDPVIARSWERCREKKVNSNKGAEDILTPEEIKRTRARLADLIRIAKPFMQDLYQYVTGSGFVVILNDEQGYILELVGDRDFIDEGQELSLRVGASWSEASKGTNAMGTCIFERKPVQVYATEHYVRANQLLTCSAAPIFDPEGKLLGVLDVTGHYLKAHSHTLGMVVAAAGAIENQMRLEKATGELLMSYQWLNTILESISEGLISVDSHGVIVQMNSVAGKILGVDSRECIGKGLQAVLRDPQPIMGLLDLGREGYSDREMAIETNRGHCHIVATARVMKGNEGTLGVVITMRETRAVHWLVNRMVGAQARFTFSDIMGRSEGIQQATALARQVARGNSTILLQGESGTGKEMFAQAIHNYSGRRNGPFVAINCAAIPRDLVESELFGYEEGSFTGARKGGRPGKFELANGGTVFLDEIGDMPLETQVKLLRVLQDRQIMRVGGQAGIPVDIRVIAATNKDLQQEIARGHFREDLYYRLNVIPIVIPPLREREQDLGLLAHNVVEKLSPQLGKVVSKIDAAAMRCIQRYRWPGNVRELENVLERAINIASTDTLRVENLPDKIRLCGFPRVPAVPLRDSERSIIVQAIRSCGGNMSQTARSLKIGRTTLYRKLKEFDIDVDSLISSSAD